MALHFQSTKKKLLSCSKLEGALSLFWSLTTLDRDVARKGSLHSSSPPSVVWVPSDCFWVGGRELEKPLLLKVEGGMASRSLTLWPPLNPSALKITKKVRNPTQL